MHPSIRVGGCAIFCVAISAACGERTEHDSRAHRQNIWIDPDGTDGEEDNGRLPQVVQLNLVFPDGGPAWCTAWLSSSNTLTTAAHCVEGVVLTRTTISALNASGAQKAALDSIGPIVETRVHPHGSDCYGADIAVLRFTNPIPRDVLKPLPVMPARAEDDEPECDGADRCVFALGAGRIDEECNNVELDVSVGTTVRRIHAESGLGDGHCDPNGDMLYGEYDIDDSTTCLADSGGPVIYGPTGEVIAIVKKLGGDGNDDIVGPVLWTGTENAARQFLALNALDTDGDGVDAARDNCDLTANPAQDDWNRDGIGDACQDSDGDGLLDEEELRRLGTDPGKADTDGDGLSDGQEVRDTYTDPRRSDSDGDGLSDGQEVSLHHTDPLKADTDGDGLTDGQEVNTHRTDPLKPDTDGDGLSDGDEVNTYRTDPLNTDTDGDDLSDGQEVNVYRTNPLDSDTDDDLLSDGFEVAAGLDPRNPDTDGDGLIDGKDVEFVSLALAGLPDASFRGSRNPLLNHLKQAERKALASDHAGAIERLQNLRKHLDGCGAQPGNDDWIVNCPDQRTIRALIDLLIANLRT